MRKMRNLVLGLLALAPLGLSGCWPFSMGLATPILMPPWVAERMEEKYCWKNDFRTPILPPIREGFRRRCARIRPTRRASSAP